MPKSDAARARGKEQTPFEEAARRLQANVRRLRERANLTQEELAEHGSVAARHIQRVESGAANPSLRVVADLAAALGVGVKDLFVWAPRPETRRAGRPRARRTRRGGKGRA